MTLRPTRSQGHGVAELLVVIADKLCDSMPPPGSPVPVTDRQARLLEEIETAESGEAIKVKLRELIGVNILQARNASGDQL